MFSKKTVNFDKSLEVQSIFYNCLAKAESKEDFETLLIEEGLFLTEFLEDRREENEEKIYRLNFGLFCNLRRVYEDKLLQWELSQKKIRRRKKELKKLISDIEYDAKCMEVANDL